MLRSLLLCSPPSPLRWSAAERAGPARLDSAVQWQGPRRLDRQDRRPRAWRQLREHVPGPRRAHGGFVRSVHRPSTRDSGTSSIVAPTRTTASRSSTGSWANRRRAARPGRCATAESWFTGSGPRRCGRTRISRSPSKCSCSAATAPRNGPPPTCARPDTNVVIDGSLFTTHCLNSKSKTYHGDQWVRVEAEVLGSERITHFVNGEPCSSTSNRRLAAATSLTTTLR